MHKLKTRTKLSVVMMPVILLIMSGVLINADLNTPELYLADYYPQPHYQYQSYRYQVPETDVDEDNYMHIAPVVTSGSDEPGYFVDYPINNRPFDNQKLFELLERNSLHKGKPNTFNKRVLSSFRERMEREKSKEEQEKLAELQKLQVDDRDIGRGERDYIDMIEDLWEKYKNSHNFNYNTDAPIFVDEMKQRDIQFPGDYSTLGWSGVGYKKRSSPDLDLQNNIYESGGNRLKYRFINPLRSSSEIYTNYPDEYLHAKRKRFPVAKRSSNFYSFASPGHHKRGVNQEHVYNNTNKKLKNVSSSGTDPKIVKDLSNIFGNKEVNEQNNTGSVTDMKKKINEKKKSVSQKSTITLSPVQDTTANIANSDKKHAHDNSHVHENKKENKQITHDHEFQSESLNIKKKSIDLSNYFGIDRRKKKSETNDIEIDNDWLIKRYNKAVAIVVKRNSEYPLNIFRNHNSKKNSQADQKPESKSDETKLQDMDDKLKNIEDLIIDEAIKYTGAHEGETNPAELQEVKDKVISRLAAAYSLEKMRRALSEFKSSLATQKYGHSQKESIQAQVNTESSLDSGRQEMKKKNMKQEENCALKMECDNKATNEIEVTVEDIGSNIGTGQCSVIENRCRRLMYGGFNDMLYSVCKWHQVCTLCDTTMDEDDNEKHKMTPCDVMFLSHADALCHADVLCQWVARPALAYLRQLQDAAPTILFAQCDRTVTCTR